MLRNTVRFILIGVLAGGSLFSQPNIAEGRGWRRISDVSVNIERVCLDGIQLQMASPFKTFLIFGTDLLDNRILISTSVTLPLNPIELSSLGYNKPLSYSAALTQIWTSPMAFGSKMVYNVGGAGRQWFMPDNCYLADPPDLLSTTWLSKNGTISQVPAFPVAYIFDRDTQSANDFVDTFGSFFGYQIYLLPKSDVDNFDFSTVRAIVVGPGTDTSTIQWGQASAVEKIRNARRPVIGIGPAGYALFSQMKLSMSRMPVIIDKGLDVLVRTQPTKPLLFTSPNDVYLSCCAASTKADLYLSYLDPVLYAALRPSQPFTDTNVSFLASMPDQSSFPLVAEVANNTCFLLWGFDGAFSQLDYSVGKKTFENALWGSACSSVPPVAPVSYGVTSTVFISDSLLIRDLNVNLAIEHDSSNVLTARLISPAGKSVTLFSNLSASNYSLGSNCSDIDGFVFDSESSFHLPSVNQPVTNSSNSLFEAVAFQPAGPGKFSDYYGDSTRGQWTLAISTTQMSSRADYMRCWNINIEAQAIFVPSVLRDYDPKLVPTPTATATETPSPTPTSTATWVPGIPTLTPTSTATWVPIPGIPNATPTRMPSPTTTSLPTPFVTT